MKPKVKIKLSDFWVPDEEIMNKHLFRTLLNHFALELSNEPDVLFFSNSGLEHLQYDCLKIFYTGENVKPDYRYSDFSFSFEPTSEKNFQYPVFAIQTFFPQFRDQQCTSEMYKLRSYPKKKFCNFVYKNHMARERIQFCQKLMAYKAVDCPGVVLNNMPAIDVGISRDWQMTKLNFIKHHKFTIAFENESSLHYTTEKIYHALLAGSIPIYWGDPVVVEYFNPECFVNCHDYNNFEEVVAMVVEIDNNNELYRRYITASPVLPDSRIHAITEEAIAERFAFILYSKERTKPVSQRWPFKIYRYIKLRNQT